MGRVDKIGLAPMVSRAWPSQPAARREAMRGTGFRLSDAGLMIMQGLAFGWTRMCPLDPFYPDLVRAW